MTNSYVWDTWLTGASTRTAGVDTGTSSEKRTTPIGVAIHRWMQTLGKFQPVTHMRKTNMRGTCCIANSVIVQLSIVPLVTAVRMSTNLRAFIAVPRLLQKYFHKRKYIKGSPGPRVLRTARVSMTMPHGQYAQQSVQDVNVH
eukprot:2419231-Amphidinium_carterae.1